MIPLPPYWLREWFARSRYRCQCVRPSIRKCWECRASYGRAFLGRHVEHGDGGGIQNTIGVVFELPCITVIESSSLATKGNSPFG